MTITGATKFLSICTSFRRPAMLQDMLKTFYANRSEGTEVFIYLHEDDPHLAEYKKFISLHNHMVGKHKNLQEVINTTVFELFPGIPHYQTIVDDQLIHTKGWDAILRDALETRAGGWGFACGRDGSNDDNWHIAQHPSAEVYSWKMAKTLGYVYPRCMGAMQLDVYAKTLGLAINGLVFCPEVFIQHLWYGGCKLPGDANIKEKYTPENIAKAMEGFAQWEREEKQIAIDKIMAAKAKE